MSNQAHKEPREDAAEKRREYLRKNGTAHTTAGLYAVTAMAFGTFATLCIFTQGISFVHIVPAVITIAITLRCGWLFSVYVKEAKSVPYVPPVSVPSCAARSSSSGAAVG